MSDTLRLGRGLELPIAAVTRTAAVVGQKGTGKTSTAVVMVEEASAAGAHFAWMDPTGAASGLRASADGDGPGLDCVVMGGFNGDVPLDPYAGAVVARLVVVEGYSVVCDLERMPRSQQITFVADFSEAALELCRSAVTVVYDEAPRFVPQGGAGVDDDGTRCRVAVTELVMLGRRKGLGSILISQRPSKLHKDVLEQSDVLIAHRLMGNNDRKAIAGWLEDHGDEAADWLKRISSLDTGQAVVLAPEYRVGGVFQIRPKTTFDSSATPEVGVTMVTAPRGRGTLDLADLEAKMGSALEAAQENDPAALKRKIARLEAQIVEGGGADAGELDAARARVADLERELAEAWQQAAKSEHVVDAVRAALSSDSSTSSEVPKPEPVASPEPAPAPRPATSTAANAEPAGPGADAGPAPTVAGADLPSIKAGMRRMLDVMHRYGRLPRRDLAILSKVSPVSGTVSDYLSVLRQHGLIEEADGLVAASAAGIALVATNGHRPPKFTPEEVYALWAGDLKAGARRMVDHLMRAYPDGYTRKELAGLAGISPQSGTVSDYMSVLRRRGLVEERARRVYAGPVLYLGSTA